MKLYERGGKLWIDFFYLSKRYRRTLGLDATKANIRLAESKIIPEVTYKLSQGTFFEIEETQVDKDITVDEMAKISFEIHKCERREFTRISIASNYERHIKKPFGKKAIKNIKPSELALWQNKLSEKLAPKTVKTIRTIFNTIIMDALKDDVITKNPFSHIKSPTLTDVREKKPFSVVEIFKILDNADEKMRAFFAIGFFTGMRTGEIIGLKWEDVDFKDNIIKVRRSRRQGTETLPKTQNSIRDVEIIGALEPYLKKHKEFCKKEQVYLFETYKGEPFNTTDKISFWYWKPLLESLKIPYRNLYQMRHTFASMMISNGEDILWVSNMLGHKDSSMALEKYARYIKKNDRKRGVFLVA